MSPEYIQRYYVVDHLGNMIRSWTHPPIPKPEPLKRREMPRLRLAKVDLPKLESAILNQPHITKGRLERAKDRTKELQLLWDEGWRPSWDAMKVLDSTKNPYIK